MLEVLNRWIGRVFDPECRDETADQLLASVGSTGADSAQETQAKDEPPRRAQRSIGSRTQSPPARTRPINAAHAELEAAEVEQARQPESKTISRAEVYAMIAYLGDVGAALGRGDPTELRKLYEMLRLEMTYHADEKAIDAAIRLGRDSVNRIGPCRELSGRVPRRTRSRGGCATSTAPTCRSRTPFVTSDGRPRRLRVAP